MNKEKNLSPSQGLNLCLPNTSQKLLPLNHQDSCIEIKYLFARKKSAITHWTNQSWYVVVDVENFDQEGTRSCSDSLAQSSEICSNHCELYDNEYSIHSYAFNLLCYA